MRSLGLLVLLLGLLTETHGAYTFRRWQWALPGGFNVEPFVPGVGMMVGNARSLSLSGNSRVNGATIAYVGSVSYADLPMNITALVDRTGRGEADYTTVIIREIAPVVNGIAWYRGSLYFAAQWPNTIAKKGWSTIFRLDNADQFALQKRTAKRKDLVVVRAGMPADRMHSWKYLRFGPDGRLYIPLGAPCNSCPVGLVGPAYKGWEYAALHSMNPDGSNLTVVARGIRNTVGFDWHPVTKQLYFTDNGRDSWDLDPDVTDNRPDCELNVITSKRPGRQHFGFPWCHTGAVRGPEFQPYRRLPGAGINLVDPGLNVRQSKMICNGPNLTFTPAIQAMGPHVSPLGMRFYRWFPGANFPRSFDNTIIVTNHGSWNRQRPIGARLMQVVLDPANPTKVKAHLPFLSGGVPGDRGGTEGPVPPNQPNTGYIFRPMDVEQMPDGSLLMSDDVAGGGNVYRIFHQSAKTCHSPKTELNIGFTLQGTVIPGASKGCVVNLGIYGTPRFRRCLQVEAVAGSRRWVQLATSLAVVGKQVVLRGALVIGEYACQNGPAGWAALGLPAEQNVRVMKDGEVFIARPMPYTTETPTGATVVTRTLAGNFPDDWTASNSLFRKAALNSYRSGSALVTTFDMVLPRAWQLAAARAGKIPFPAGSRNAASPNGLSMMFAMGPFLKRTYMMHWVSGRISIPFQPADIGAAVPGGQPVLNRGAGPYVPPSMPPPPAAPRRPPPPRPPPAGTCPASAQCCVGGVTYDACLTDSGSGTRFTQYYKLAGSQLQVAIRAPLDNVNKKWIAWGYNPSGEGMAGTDAFFAFTASAGSVVTAQYNLPGYYLGDEPVNVQFAEAGSGAAGGNFWAAFTLAWPSAANKFTLAYGTGRWTAAGGLLKHAIKPPKACVTKSGGTVSSVSLGDCQ